MIDKIILGFLKIKTLTAYDIKKAMEQSISCFYSSSFGSINPALKKLEHKKLVVCHDTVENNRVKKYYEITPDGDIEYQNWLKEPITIGRIKEEALVRIFFMGDNDAETRKKLISDYLTNIREVQEQLEELRKGFSEDDIPEEYKLKARYQLATLEFGIDYYKFTKDWFQKLLDDENN